MIDASTIEETWERFCPSSTPEERGVETILSDALAYAVDNDGTAEEAAALIDDAARSLTILAAGLRGEIEPPCSECGLFHEPL